MIDDSQSRKLTYFSFIRQFKENAIFIRRAKFRVKKKKILNYRRVSRQTEINLRKSKICIDFLM